MAARQGSWIPVYSDLTRHEKTQRVADQLRIKQHGPQAVAGYLVALWNRAAQERVPVPAGGPIAERVVEHWAEWEGRRGAFLEALVAAGFLDRRDDGLYLHDWEDGGGKSVKVRAHATERMRRYRDANSDANSARHVTSLDQTRPDQKIPPYPPASGGERLRRGRRRPEGDSDATYEAELDAERAALARMGTLAPREETSA